MSINEIIRRFKSLDLSTYPENEIDELYRKLGRIAHVQFNLLEGAEIMRARPNYNGERFTRKQDYSYKPQQFNATYQRASTPNNTMFYGAVMPRKNSMQLDNARVVGLLESLLWLHDKTQSGYQKISFGKWIVKKPLHLVAVVSHESYKNNNTTIKELADAFNNFVLKTPDDLRDKSFKFHEYIASEFSKEDIMGDYSYMISAMFSEIMANQFKFDGVLYPSVRTGGQGLNVALTTTACEKLDLMVAGECTIYKQEDKMVLGNDAITPLNGCEVVFKLNDLKNEQAACLSQIGLKSISQFQNRGIRN